MPILTSFIRNQSTKACAAAFCLALCCTAAQDPYDPSQRREEERRLPDGTLQADAIRRADYEANLKDLGRIRALTDGIEEMLKKSKGHVLSIQAMRDLEEIEKLAKRVRGRMRHY